MQVSQARPDIWASSRKGAGKEAEEKQTARSEEDGETGPRRGWEKRAFQEKECGSRVKCQVEGWSRESRVKEPREGRP